MPSKWKEHSQRREQELLYWPLYCISTSHTCPKMHSKHLHTVASHCRCQQSSRPQPRNLVRACLDQCNQLPHASVTKGPGPAESAQKAGLLPPGQALGPYRLFTIKPLALNMSYTSAQQGKGRARAPPWLPSPAAGIGIQNYWV